MGENGRIFGESCKWSRTSCDGLHFSVPLWLKTRLSPDQKRSVGNTSTWPCLHLQQTLPSCTPKEQQIDTPLECREPTLSRSFCAKSRTLFPGITIFTAGHPTCWVSLLCFPSLDDLGAAIVVAVLPMQPTVVTMAAKRTRRRSVNRITRSSSSQGSQISGRGGHPFPHALRWPIVELPSTTMRHYHDGSVVCPNSRKPKCKRYILQLSNSY